ncbi:hypothetical protein G3O08_01760 [Cryomorpha ignava]|uniref:Uncharacterized protein n=1 Tax=Cryomorpha ignava TaxID=101383 RepID=A0A7K3WKR5_9FLAO|nr:hypothetical protein [Cryomorpha ignava]NEN22229.1 hypothetical protein [Cryomorpha ignava]
MKNVVTILALSLLIFATNGCNKDDDKPTAKVAEENLTDLHDTLVGGFMSVSSGFYSYDLDIDKDSVFDLLIEVGIQWSPSYGSVFYIRLTPKNDFEMAIDSTSYTRWSWNPSLTDTVYTTYTVPVPEPVILGSTIPGSSMFNNSPCLLYYYRSFGSLGSNYTNAASYKIMAFDFVYLAFRKETDSTPVLGWLKLKYPENDGNGMFGVVLSSCRYSDDSEELVIN